jgi:hypothetical protein
MPLDPRLLTLFQLPRLTEVRWLGKQRPSLSLFTRDPDTIAEALAHPAVEDMDAYAVINQPCEDVAARHGVAEDTLFAPLRGQATSDADVKRIIRLAFDIDPTRPTGTAASLAQVQISAEVMCRVIRYLCDRGFPEQAVIASGNGTHAYNACDLANTPETAALLRALYGGLAHEFNQAGLVTFDVTVRSAAQIMRWPGSFNVKAQRTSEILTMPETFAPVSLETIQAVVKELHAKHGNKPGIGGHQRKLVVGREGGWTSERMEAFLDFHGIDYGVRKLTPQGLLMWILRPCPFNSDHKLTSPAVFVTPKGWPRFKCRHDSCAGNKWRQFLVHLNLTNGKVFSWTSHQSESKFVTS